MVCTFFGHSECYGLDAAVLRSAIEELIEQGVTEFVVGNHGQFDAMVFSTLQDVGKVYPEISYSVALAYLPTRKEDYDISGLRVSRMCLPSLHSLFWLRWSR